MLAGSEEVQEEKTNNLVKVLDFCHWKFGNFIFICFCPSVHLSVCIFLSVTVRHLALSEEDVELRRAADIAQVLKHVINTLSNFASMYFLALSQKTASLWIRLFIRLPVRSNGRLYVVTLFFFLRFYFFLIFHFFSETLWRTETKIAGRMTPTWKELRANFSKIRWRVWE